jgi:hypothetical protein
MDSGRAGVAPGRSSCPRQRSLSSSATLPFRAADLTSLARHGLLTHQHAAILPLLADHAALRPPDSSGARSQSPSISQTVWLDQLSGAGYYMRRAAQRGDYAGGPCIWSFGQSALFSPPSAMASRATLALTIQRLQPSVVAQGASVNREVGLQLSPSTPVMRRASCDADSNSMLPGVLSALPACNPPCSHVCSRRSAPAW